MTPAAAAILRAYAGTNSVVVGRGRPVREARNHWERFANRHRALFLHELIPVGGATARELSGLSGLGKKTTRARLRALEREGVVRTEDQRWYLCRLPRRDEDVVQT